MLRDVLVHHLPGRSARPLRPPPLEAHRAGPAGLGPLQAPHPDEDRRRRACKIAIARFSRTLSTLVAAGVDIVKALEITGATSGNWVIEQALDDVRMRVQEGVPIAEPLAENPAFPPMVSQMIKIGEETGELEKMLGKIADFYEDEVDTAIKSLTSIIEPMMMIGVGFMVGVIVISMYLPMFKMLTLVGNSC